MSTHPTPARSGLFPADFYARCVSRKRLIALFAAGGLLLGAAASIAIPSKFQASASIEPAKVANTPIEPKEVLAEKMRSPTYYSAATLARCGVDGLANGAQVLVARLQPAVLRASQFVTVQYQAASPEAAKGCLQSVLDDVKASEADIARPVIENQKSLLKALEAQLAIAEGVAKQLAVENMRFDFTDPKFSAATLLLNTAISKKTEISDLALKIGAARLSLVSPQTKEAAFATPIHAPVRPVGPNRLAILVLGTLLGLAVGILAILRQSSPQPLVPAAAVAAV